MNKLKYALLGLLLCFSFGVTSNAEAATLKLSPSTGVYASGNTFSVSVSINTGGKSVNAADGQLKFNPKELQVVSVSRGSSIFSLWTEEPTYSNTGGTISFGGGSPAGYSGGAGTIVTITFRTLGSGTSKVNFTSGSVLAADGLGTNILTDMSGGSFTIAAVADAPAPEYIAPANTPKAPAVTSASHPDQSKWYTEKTATFSWDIPSDVTAVRTAFDKNPGTVPTVVYESPIREKTISDLPEGVSYFHIQFKNAEGWGRITHYKVSVDTEKPTDFTIVEDTSNPDAAHKVLIFTAKDTSVIREYKIQIDGKDPVLFKDEKGDGRYTLESLTPGYHTIVVEAFDSAGNSTIGSYSFTIDAFEKPIFFDFPTRISTDIIPAIKGKTKPQAKVRVEVKRIGEGAFIERVEGSEDQDSFTIAANDSGEFTYVPNSSFEPGVYILTATAKDQEGRMSETSDEIRIIVEKPGYVVIGSLVVNALSVIIPLLALSVILIFGTWYLWHILSVWRRKLLKETTEAENQLSKEFAVIIKNLHDNVIALKEVRKGKLTKSELDLFEQVDHDLKTAQHHIAKEIEDIEDLIR